jgi:hypothetical protein
MADASNPFDARRRRPRDWGDAFSNLPLDTPPLSVWSQIEARLNAPTQTFAEAVVMRMPAADSSAPARRKFSNRAWLALAASVSALAILPLLWSNMRETSNTTSPTLADRLSAPSPRVIVDAALATRADTQPTVAPRDRSNERTGTTDLATVAASAASARTPIEDAASSIETTSPSPLASVASATPATTNSTSHSPAPAIDEPSTPTPAELASADNAPLEKAALGRDGLPQNAVLIGEADADATEREMELLYAASAQLETLLAYTRDPRVETGPAAALSSEIHTRIAKIDARLAQPGLSANEQYVLWQARVGTLRQAVAVESELRALSAEGQGYEGEVVEIY